MMDYNEVVDSLKKSDNPLVKQMVSSSQEVVDLWKKLVKMSSMDEKTRWNYILGHAILELEYTNKKGVESTYRCTSNPFFVALLSSRKFTEYKTVSTQMKKIFDCHRTGHIRTWNLVENKPIEMVMKKIKPNFNNAIGLSISEKSLSDENKELVNETFRSLRPDRVRNEDKNETKSDLKELFRM
jgi:hypothetical protein